MSTDIPLDSMTPDEKRKLLSELLARRDDRPLVEPLSFPQERLWFLDRLNPGLPTYNIPASFPFSGPVDVHALERAIGEIVARHETLRTTFVRRGAEQEAAAQQAAALDVRPHGVGAGLARMAELGLRPADRRCDRQVYVGISTAARGTDHAEVPAGPAGRPGVGLHRIVVREASYPVARLL